MISFLHVFYSKCCFHFSHISFMLHVPCVSPPPSFDRSCDMWWRAHFFYCSLYMSLQTAVFMVTEKYFSVRNIISLLATFFFRVNWLWMCLSRRKFAWPYFTRTCARTREVSYMRCIHVSSPHYGILQEFISLWFGWSRSLSKLVENMTVEELKFCYGKKGSVWSTRRSTLGGRL